MKHGISLNLFHAFLVAPFLYVSATRPTPLTQSGLLYLAIGIFAYHLYLASKKL